MKRTLQAARKAAKYGVSPISDKGSDSRRLDRFWSGQSAGRKEPRTTKASQLSDVQGTLIPMQGDEGLSMAENRRTVRIGRWDHYNGKKS